MYQDAWDSFWRLIKVLIGAGVVVLIAVHFGLSGLGHASAQANGAVGTIEAAMHHLYHEIPLP
jgi:hypothetical protein